MLSIVITNTTLLSLLHAKKRMYARKKEVEGCCDGCYYFFCCDVFIFYNFIVLKKCYLLFIFCFILSCWFSVVLVIIVISNIYCGYILYNSEFLLWELCLIVLVFGCILFIFWISTTPTSREEQKNLLEIF